MLRGILIIFGLIGFAVGVITLLTILGDPEELLSCDASSQFINILRNVFSWVGFQLLALCVLSLVIATGIFAVLIYRYFIIERRIRILLRNFATLVISVVLLAGALILNYTAVGIFADFFSGRRVDVWVRRLTGQAFAVHLSFYNGQEQVEDLVIPVRHGIWVNTGFYGQFSVVTAELIAVPGGEILSGDVAFGWDGWEEGISSGGRCSDTIDVSMGILESNGRFSIKFGDFI